MRLLQFYIDYYDIYVAINFQPNILYPNKGYIRLLPVPISIHLNYFLLI